MDPYSLTAPPRKFQNNNRIPPRELKDEELTQEISWSESDILRAFSAYGQNPDPVVRRKGLQIYREMMEDDQIKVCIDLRKKARLSTPWTIEPGDDKDTQSVEMADFVTHCFDRMAGTLEDKLEEIYSAFEFGFSLTEIIYELIEDGPFKGKIGIQALKTREPFNYDFKVDVHGNLLGMIYTGIAPKESGISYGPAGFVTNQIDIGSGTVGTLANPFPPEKFIIYSYAQKFSNWYGRSDLLAAFRWWLMKKHFTKFWAIWLERYASPTVVSTYKRDAGLKKKNLEAMDDFLRNLSVRNGIRVSDAWTVESLVHGSSGQGSGSTAYETAVESCNRFMAHSILCPNLLGITEQKSVGSFALGKKHFDAFIWVLAKIGRDTEETIIDEQVIRRLIDLNFFNVDPAKYPKFKFESVDDEQTEARARILSIMAAAGYVDTDEDWVRDYIKLPERKAPPAQEEDRIAGDKPSPDEEEEEENNGKVSPGAKRFKKETPAVKKPNLQFQERESNQFEKKVKVKEFKRELDAADFTVTAELAEELEDIRDFIVSTVQKRKIIQKGNPRDVESITVNVRDIKAIIKKWMTKIFLDSKLRALEELGRSGVRIEVVKKFQELSVPFEPWEPLPPKEAVDFFNRKVTARIVDRNGKKKLITIASRKELSYFDEKAFAVAGIIRDDILNDTKQLILNGIKRQDEAGTIKDIKSLFNRYLEQGVEVDEELLKPHRLQTIVRTNVAEAMNEGRAAMYSNPDVRGFVEFWEYSAILDARTTSYCRCMDGKVFRIEDLDALKPPAHFNCRSISVPITLFEIQGLRKQGRGVDVSDPCPDRMVGFADIKREPIQVSPSSEPLASVPTVAVPASLEQRAVTDTKDSPPAPRSGSDERSTEQLRRELSETITRCPYSSCGSSKVILQISQRQNITEFLCQECRLPFRVTSKGDLYLFDTGIERWERVSQGMVPSYFRSYLQIISLKHKDN